MTRKLCETYYYEYERVIEMFLFYCIIGNSVFRHNSWLKILVVMGALTISLSALYLPNVETSHLIVNGSLSILNRVRDSGYFTEASAMWVTMMIGGLMWLISKYREKKKNSQPHAGVVITETGIDD